MTLHYLINKPIDQVFACLSNMEVFVTVHPVIYKIEQLTDKNYQFYEKLKLFPAKFNYTVTIEKLEQNRHVHMYSKVQRGVELNLYFSLTTQDNITSIEETIHVKAPVVIKQIFQIILKRMHRSLFKNIQLR